MQYDLDMYFKIWQNYEMELTNLQLIKMIKNTKTEL